MKKGDKVYEAWILNTISVRYSEYTITKVAKGGAWIIDKYKNERYASKAEFDLNYGRTKQEAIDKCIKLNKIWIADYEKRIKLLEAEKEKINGNQGNRHN